MTGFDFENFDEKEKQITNFILQEIKDTIEGGLTSRNLASFRNTYVINAQDSLDADFPMYVHFNIINEMIKIVSVKVSFWIDPFRAYSTAVPSGGGSTSGASCDLTAVRCDLVVHEDVSVFVPAELGDWMVLGYAGEGVLTNHTHTTPNHAHDVTFGIYEEDNSPTIKFYISENEGVSYNDKFFGNYDTNKSDLDITSILTSSGSKLIKFTSDVRARLSVQIEIKLDIKAR